MYRVCCVSAGLETEQTYSWTLKDPEDKCGSTKPCSDHKPNCQNEIYIVLVSCDF